MSDSVEVDRVRDMALGLSLAAVVVAAVPRGGFTRLAPFFDEVSSVREKFSQDGSPTETTASEALLLDGYAAALDKLWEAKDQIETSMRFAQPSLGMLMERDVVLAAIASASEDVVSHIKSWGKCWTRDNFSRDEMDEYIDADGDFTPLNEAISRKLDSLFADERLFTPDAGSLMAAQVTNNRWYVQPAVSLGETLGVAVEVPASVDAATLRWLQ